MSENERWSIDYNQINELKAKLLNENPHLKNYPNLFLKEIDSNLFAFSYEWKNIDYFFDKNLKWILDIKSIRENNYDLKTKDEWYKKVLLYVSWQAWYIEIEENWIYNMYSVTDVDEETGKFKLWNKVNIFSKEYYLAWEKIWFYYKLMKLTVWLDSPNDEKIEEKRLKTYIDDKVIKIKDLEKLKDQWQISKKTFEEFFPKVKALLKWQIKDNRFWEIWKQITIEELTEYLNKSYITQSEFEELSKILEETKKKIEAKENEQSSLINWTKNKLAELKSDINNIA